MLDYLEAILSADTVQDAWLTLSERMDSFGFDRLLFGTTHNLRHEGYGAREDLFLLSSFDQAYMDGFVNDGLYRHSPVIHWAAQNVGAISWRSVEERQNELSPDAKRVIAFNKSMNISAGYSIGFQDGILRNKGAIALTARPGLSQDDVEDIWKASGREIEIMNNVFYLKIRSLPQERPHRTLTKRQREVLEWVGEGKTNQDIAQLIGLTSATVEKHLRLAREQLQVDTTAQAVLKASFQNQIYVLEQ